MHILLSPFHNQQKLIPDLFLDTVNFFLPDAISDVHQVWDSDDAVIFHSSTRPATDAHLGADMQDVPVHDLVGQLKLMWELGDER
jgi:hypothetical protein